MVGKVNKYGVPIDDSTDTRQGLMQPKFLNRFRVIFDGLGRLPLVDEDDETEANNIVTGSVETFQKPTFTFEKHMGTSYRSRAFYTSRPTYDDFTITIRDEITNSVVSKIYNQLKMQTYKYHPATANAEGGLNKSPFLGVSCKFDAMVDIMDGRTNHKPLETWKFFGCLITSYSTPTLSYEDDQGINIITLQCSFDYVDVFRNGRVAFASNHAYEDDDGIGVDGDLAQSISDAGEETESPGLIDRTTEFFRDRFR